MMPCGTHGTACAYQDEDPSICPICHASWEKITAPATRTIVHRGINPKTKKPTITEEVRYLNGYGELPLNHFWRHALSAVPLAERGTKRQAIRSRKAVA